MSNTAPVTQPITAPLTRAAMFVVFSIERRADSWPVVREVITQLSALVRSVGFRDGERSLSCIMGIGAEAWDHLFEGPRPAELHTFEAIGDAPRVAVSTPGDLLLHIRANHMDLCFELARQITARLQTVAKVEDEVHGFRYFDARDLLGFVDGTENPNGQAARDAVFIGEEDAAFAGGSYVIVQKYLHDLDGWNALGTEKQERIIGRTKLDDIELPDSIKPSCAHNALNTITKHGREIKIVRDNMPFGEVGSQAFGTYFIGYARSPATTEEMLRNMFVGRPPGNYDRILDFSRAVTGTLFFVPSADFLDDPAQAAVAGEAPALTEANWRGSGG